LLYTEDNHVCMALCSYTTRIWAFLTAAIQALPSALARAMRVRAHSL